MKLSLMEIGMTCNYMSEWFQLRFIPPLPQPPYHPQAGLIGRKHGIRSEKIQEPPNPRNLIWSSPRTSPSWNIEHVAGMYYFGGDNLGGFCVGMKLT